LACWLDGVMVLVGAARDLQRRGLDELRGAGLGLGDLRAKPRVDLREHLVEVS